ncbi:MAG: hypothetical protein KGR26_03440 [Cyanobacteria bacterium REEB65]|nr:hypothetical protein [Cyanobacteria bacterium REEB65]
MAGTPQDPKSPLPQRVVPQKRTAPFDPDEVYDLRLGPGDSTVQAAYARTSRGTTFLGAAGPAIRQRGTERLEGNDALLLAKRAKRARSLTFTVQGIMWRAGFAPDLSQTPLGQATVFRKLADAEIQSPAGALLRPADPRFELVFRELIPRPLIEQADQTFGPIRKLERIALYYFPAGEGATAGLVVQYAEQPVWRPHVLYLQTNIKHASPTVLEQIAKTFSAAVPRALEAAKQPTAGDFWQELDKAAYQLTATFRNSILAGNTQAARATLKKQAKKAETRVTKAASVVDTVGRALDDAARVPGRFGVSVVRSVTSALVKTIQAIDNAAGRKD